MPHFRTWDYGYYDYEGSADEEDTFDFSNVKAVEKTDEDVDGDDFLVWQREFGSDTSSDTNEPGLAGVTIYSDANLDGEFDTTSTTFEGDFII